MVVFTCNNCGDSLQKPKVEKHYQFSCKSGKNLTCVDCLKDFHDDYVDHNKCLTEDQRYAAKGKAVMAPGKGEKKQETWVEMIQSIIIEQQDSVKVSQRKLLNLLGSFTNVPRKKKKFINFVKSSTSGRTSDEDIDSVWDLIEAYKEKSKPNNDVKSEGPIDQAKEKITRESEAANDVSQPKKSKKQTNIPEEVNGNGNNNPEENTEYVKVRKEQKVTENGNSENSKINYKKQAKPVETSENGTLDGKVKEKKKKRKIEVTENEVSAPKKSKKQKKNQEENDNGAYNKSEENTEDSEVKKEKKANENGGSTSFDFKENILKILQKKKTIPMEKLGKKIVKKYIKSLGDSDEQHIMKKLKQRLKKMNTIKISDGVVTLDD